MRELLIGESGPTLLSAFVGTITCVAGLTLRVIRSYLFFSLALATTVRVHPHGKPECVSRVVHLREKGDFSGIKKEKNNNHEKEGGS